MSMTVTGHVRATIVRPRMSLATAVGTFVGTLLSYVLKAFVLCWLLPAFTRLAAVFLLGVLTFHAPDADYWTEGPR